MAKKMKQVNEQSNEQVKGTLSVEQLVELRRKLIKKYYGSAYKFADHEDSKQFGNRDTVVQSAYNRKYPNVELLNFLLRKDGQPEVVSEVKTIRIVEYSFKE